jgi:hypothetical protein
MPWGWTVEHVIKDWLCVARPILLGPRVGSSWGLLPDQRSPLQRLRVKCATCRGDVWHTGNTFWEKPMNCSYRYWRSHIVTQEISRSHAWLSRLAQVEHLEIGIMNPRRSATMTAVLCGMGGVAWFAGFGSAGTENTAAPTLNRLPPFLNADFKLADAPQPTAMGKGDADRQDTAASDEPQSIVESVLTNSSEMLPFETPPVQVATASTPNAMRRDTSIEGLNECPVREICIDRYLWALYQRTPKEDTSRCRS